ncbi:MAG: hypothetical protein E4G92_02770, partial [Bacteroidia bacterium]
MKSRRLLLTAITAILLSVYSLAQPAWVPGTPAVNGITPYSINIDYGINMTGTVYITVYNFNFTVGMTSSLVRSYALLGPAGGRVAVAVLPVNAGNINVVLSRLFNSLASNTTYTFFIVAENSAGVLQSVPIKLNAITPPCPKINLFTFFGNLGECVNLGAQGTYQVAPLGILPTGILKGTRWSVDWGDGSPVWSYISSAD